MDVFGARPPFELPHVAPTSEQSENIVSSSNSRHVGVPGDIVVDQVAKEDLSWGAPFVRRDQNGRAFVSFGVDLNHRDFDKGRKFAHVSVAADHAVLDRIYLELCQAQLQLDVDDCGQIIDLVGKQISLHLGT